ncbi:MAG: 23S rRNA (pseudouridine(1915)-N(3))-methyltransferase RlmH [Planctomycetota bacterium]
MRILLLAVGRLRSQPLRELCADYLERLSRYGPAGVEELKPAGPGAPAQCVAQESARVLAALLPTDRVCVLDERGAQLSSPELCQLLKAHELSSAKRLVFVLGGAYGVSDAVRRRGKLLALSRLTLPHELCRTLLLEQLYRARTIQHGQPYHHG